MRSRLTLALTLAAVVLGGAVLIPTAYAELTSRDDGGTVGTGQTPAPSAATPAPPTLAPATVSVDTDGFLSWALLERQTGTISGSQNLTATSSTESMIKIWIVSDVLRVLGDRSPTPQLLKWASAAIRDSDDDATNALYNGGGKDKIITRMIKMCGLTETKAIAPRGTTIWWSYTQISARDAVRLGECVRNGTAAGPKWTEWVLNEMSKVRGTTAPADQEARRGGGRWGIIDGLPEEITSGTRISIKNGWTAIGADQSWHVTCLAIADDWVLSVLMRYPTANGLDYGAQACASVASQLVTARPNTGV
ncbi:serine hydrolase [Micromonospora sp. NPDC003197]